MTKTVNCSKCFRSVASIDAVICIILLLPMSLLNLLLLGADTTRPYMWVCWTTGKGRGFKSFLLSMPVLFTWHILLTVLSPTLTDLFSFNHCDLLRLLSFHFLHLRNYIYVCPFFWRQKHFKTFFLSYNMPLSCFVLFQCAFSESNHAYLKKNISTRGATIILSLYHIDPWGTASTVQKALNLAIFSFLCNKLSCIVFVSVLALFVRACESTHWNQKTSTFKYISNHHVLKRGESLQKSCQISNMTETRWAVKRGSNEQKCCRLQICGTVKGYQKSIVQQTQETKPNHYWKEKVFDCGLTTQLHL